MTSAAQVTLEPVARVRVPRPRRRSLRGRLIARGLFVLSAVLTRLPERPLNRIAWAIGGALYRAQPARRRLVRANLERVVSYLAAHDMATPQAAAAVRDGKHLECLTRAAFGHYVRSYLEGATLQSLCRGRSAGARRAGRREDRRTGLSAPAEQVRRSSSACTSARSRFPLCGPRRAACRSPRRWRPWQIPTSRRTSSTRAAARGLTIVPLHGAAAKVRAALAAQGDRGARG